MINTCCNLYFYYNFIVHGGIRHLEINAKKDMLEQVVHGGIRHLEMVQHEYESCKCVHGGIRHLENDSRRRMDIHFVIKVPTNYNPATVHGGIRHLEITVHELLLAAKDHGGIRHLEIQTEHF